MALEGTEATEDGRPTAQVSLLTGLQSPNVEPSTSTPERSSTRINKRPSSIGEEGYYRLQDLEALYAKWKTEYNRNKRAHLKQGRLLDMRKNKRMISKRRHKRLHHRSKEKRASRTSDDEDENNSKGDEQSFSDEEVAGDLGLLTGDSDDEEGSSRGRRRRKRSDSGSKGNRRHSPVKSSSSSSSKKQLKWDQATKQEAKRHTCPVCGKRFSRPSQLYTHSLTHSGEVNFLLCQNEGPGHNAIIFLCSPCSIDDDHLETSHLLRVFQGL